MEARINTSQATSVQQGVAAPDAEAAHKPCGAIVRTLQTEPYCKMDTFTVL